MKYVAARDFGAKAHVPKPMSIPLKAKNIKTASMTPIMLGMIVLSENIPGMKILQDGKWDRPEDQHSETEGG